MSLATHATSSERNILQCSGHYRIQCTILNIQRLHHLMAIFLKNNLQYLQKLGPQIFFLIIVTMYLRFETQKRSIQLRVLS